MSEKNKYDFKYCEIDLSEVINYYSKDFDFKNQECISIEYFIDTIKQKVIFKAFLKEKE